MALTQAQKQFLKAAKDIAQELGPRGRELTSLIGELTACEKLNLTWEPEEGYDAKCGEMRVQIKTRKSWSTPKVNPAGRIGRFEGKKGYLFDIAVYVELGEDFNATGIWRMEVDEVRSLEGEEGGRGLHVRSFVKGAKPTFTS